MTTVDAPACKSHDETGSPARWQFSLKSAFLATAVAAGVACLVGYRGFGSLVLSAGLIAAWLNVRGRLDRLQTRKVRPKLFYAGWMLLGASLFLPAMKGCNNQPVYGWQTAYLCAVTEAEIVHELVQDSELDAERPLEQVGSFAWITAINAANLLLVLSPLLLWRLQRGQGQFLGAALAIAAVSPWALAMRDPHMFIGCYVWCASFIVLLLSCRIQTRTFCVMLAIAVGYTVL
ncbi:MAG: hypothetical protein KY475_05260 [Planctomycetes bacterium]|nr:hypothetical protein [Planctomycetota bacterium]